MKVKECMTPDVRLVTPTQTILEAAKMMADHDIGALPVADNDRLVGMVTDRDIAVRAVAQGRDSSTPVREIMTREVKYCYDDVSIDEVTRNMGEQRIRRLPVVNRDKRLVGILSLGDLAIEDQAKDEAGDALHGISRPGGEHSQASRHH
jgi:CBS domain-containing protein